MLAGQVLQCKYFSLCIEPRSHANPWVLYILLFPLVLDLGAVIFTCMEAGSASPPPDAAATSIAPRHATGLKCRVKGWAVSRSRTVGLPRWRKLGGDQALEGLDVPVDIVTIPSDRN